MNTSLPDSNLPVALAPVHGPARQHNPWLTVDPLATFSSEDPTFSQLWDVVVRHWQLVAGSITASVVLALAYGIWSPKLFTATVVLEIGGYVPVIPGSGNDGGRQQINQAEYVKTQTAKLARASVADKALSHDNLASTFEEYIRSHKGGSGNVISQGISAVAGLFGQKTEKEPESSVHQHPESLLREYIKLVTVSPVKDTSLVEVSLTAADPALSQQMANAHAAGFIEQIQDERQFSSLKDLSFLQEQADELRNKVTEAEKSLAEYAESNGLLSLANGENMVVKEIADLSQQLTSVTSKRIGLQTLLEEARDQKRSESSVLDGAPTEKLIADLNQAQVESAELLQKVTADFPAAAAVQARIRMLRKVIIEQRERSIDSLSSKYQAEMNTETALRSEIAQQKEVAYETSKKAVTYNILKREYETSKDLYNAVIRELKESRLRAASKGTNITITDFASLPAVASSPKRGLAIVLALILGPALGVGLAMLMESQDTTLKSSEEVRHATLLPVLGCVPSFDPNAPSTTKAPKVTKTTFVRSHVKNLFNTLIPREPAPQASDNSDVGLPSMVTIRAPRSSVSEAFRTIRTNILPSSADSPARIILATSVSKGDGKTTLVSNLAVMLAQGGHNTILVDADTRQPAMHNWFSVPEKVAGLVDYLAGQVELDRVVVESGVPKLSLLPAGTPAPNPAELVGSKKMAELLNTLASRYDYVLIDSPPLLAVSDSLMLSRAVDGVIVVVRQDVTEKNLAIEACRQLQRVNATILGVVVNGTDEGPDYGNSYWREVA